MKIEYRNEDFQLISSLHAREKKSRWYKHFLSNGKLKIREQYHSDALFDIHYSDREHHETELPEKYRNLLETPGFRTNKPYGHFWIEAVKYNDFDGRMVRTQAEQLMQRMKILPKMRAWYVNNEFLPEL